MQEQTDLRRKASFRDKLQTLSLTNTIISIIKDGECHPQDIIDSVKLPSDTVTTILSWMEALDILYLSNGKYLVNDNDAEDAINEDTDTTSFKEINISPEKYSIYEYLRKVNRGDIQLNPEFQRNLVWRNEQKSMFIESALMGLPLPPIFLKRINDRKLIVVDGLQRTSALKEFMGGQLTLNGLKTLYQLNGKRFSEIDEVYDGYTARLEDRQMYFYVMQPSVSMSVVYDVFNRINTGGTQLTRQEIRNCIYLGQSTRLLKDIADSQIFRQSVDYALSPLRMKDREVVLRCLAFVISNYEKDYAGSMDEFLEKAMISLNKMDDAEINTLKQKSLQVFRQTYEIFGNRNFRVPTEYTRGRINIALLETIFSTFYLMNEAGITLNEVAYQDNFSALLQSKDFLYAIKWSTGSKSQVLNRFSIAHRAFNVYEI